MSNVYTVLLLIAGLIVLSQFELNYAANDGRNKDYGFVSIVSDGLGPPYNSTPCGIRSLGPGYVNLDTVFKPERVGQWINGTLKVIAGADVLSGLIRMDFTVWPYSLKFTFCDIEHEPELCPIKKGDPVVIPFNNYASEWYLMPAHYVGNITFLNEKSETVAAAEVECTIYLPRSSNKFSSLKDLLHKLP